MLVRREALLAAGLLDERFFIYSEEPDLCMRIKQAGWRVRPPAPDDDHPPRRQGRGPPEDGGAGSLHAQAVRRQVLRAPYRAAFLSAFAVGQMIRSVGRGGGDAAARREGSRRALRTLVGRVEPPFGAPPATAVSPLPSALNGRGALAHAAFEEVR